MNRRSWPIELPHIGDLLDADVAFDKVNAACSTMRFGERGGAPLSIRPELPWVLIPCVHAVQYFIGLVDDPDRCFGDGVEVLSVMTMASSIMRSDKGLRPVISMSSQTSRSSSRVLISAGFVALCNGAGFCHNSLVFHNPKN